MGQQPRALLSTNTLTTTRIYLTYTELRCLAVLEEENLLTAADVRSRASERDGDALTLWVGLLVSVACVDKAGGGVQFVLKLYVEPSRLAESVPRSCKHRVNTYDAVEGDLEGRDCSWFHFLHRYTAHSGSIAAHLSDSDVPSARELFLFNLEHWLLLVTVMMLP